jgi:hypothetical protein
MANLFTKYIHKVPDLEKMAQENKSGNASHRPAMTYVVYELVVWVLSVLHLLDVI